MKLLLDVENVQFMIVFMHMLEHEKRWRLHSEESGFLKWLTSGHFQSRQSEIWTELAIRVLFVLKIVHQIVCDEV